MKLNKTQLTNLLMKHQERDDNYIVSTPNMMHFPLCFQDEYKFATAYSLHFTHKDDAKQHTTYIVTTGEDEYYLWCSHGYLNGQIDKDEQQDIVLQTLSTLPQEIHENVSQSFELSYGAYPKDSGCNNFRLASNLKKEVDSGIESSGEVVCKHIKNMFYLIDSELDEKLQKLQNTHRKGLLKTKVLSGNLIEDKLTEYLGRGELLFFHGEGGTGKTYEIREFCEKHNLSLIKVDGHQQIEAIDLYGYVDIADDGEKCWGDGPISQAARQAKKGIKTLLFLDELALIPFRETASMKAPFEPYKGNYYIETGRKTRGEDNILVKETLVVPVENLQIVAAANFGDGYASEELDKAFKQRCLMFHYQTSEEKIQNVLTSICKEKGFSLTLVSKMIELRNSLKVLKNRGEMPVVASLRHLSRKTLELAKTEDEVYQVALDQLEQYVDLDEDGVPVEEQCEMYEEILHNIFV